MSPQLDWIVEYERLPDDELPLHEWPPPHDRRRRPPRWFWLAAGLIVVTGSIALALWLLGGRAGPLPSPDPPATRLESTIHLEIEALQAGDAEIYARLQDGWWRRENMQPPLDAWHAGRSTGRAGEIELEKVELIDQDSALAQVRLAWDGVPYRVTWFYRKEGERWLHGDWQQVNDESTVTARLWPWRAEPEITAGDRGSPVQISYLPTDRDEAGPLAWHLASLLDRCRDLLPCPAGLLTTTLELDHLYSNYYVQRISPLHYRLPSPLRVRWPADHSPEPLVLASAGRHLLFDLLALPHWDQVSPENQAALSLSAIWLAHHLLDVDPLPTTRWLEEAVRRDGRRSGVDFLSALAADVPPQLAVASAFAPGTVRTVTAMPDYFGWLVVVLDPEDRIRPSPGYQSEYPLPWFQTLQLRFDLAADPWAVQGRVYGEAAPEVTAVIYPDGWAVATLPGERGWGLAYFFRLTDGDWVLARPDETLMGERRTGRQGPFAITYWAWDEPHLTELTKPFRETYGVVASNFGLDQTREISVTAFSSPEALVLPESTARVYLASPALKDLLGRDIPPDATTEAWTLTLALLDDRLSGMPANRFYLGRGIFFWQLLQLGVDLGDLLQPEPLEAWQTWRPPADVSAPGWRPLQDLWQQPSGAAEDELVGYALLVVEHLVERWGLEIVPLILDQMETAGSMTEWVAGVSGQPMAAFETEWREWVISKWGSPG